MPHALALRWGRCSNYSLVMCLIKVFHGSGIFFSLYKEEVLVHRIELTPNGCERGFHSEDGAFRLVYASDSKINGYIFLCIH